MKDKRQEILAEILTGYSVEVTKGDLVLIDYSDGTPLEFVREIQTACLKRGARYVGLRYSHSDLVYNFFRLADREQLGYFPRHELELMKKMDAYIGVGSPLNTRTLNRIPAELLSRRQRILKPIQKERVENTRWVITRYPTHAQAQEAGVSFEEFEDLYFKACNIDWSRQAKRQEVLRKVLLKSNKVRIRAADTDLSLSIKNMPAITCAGKRNMPDGEVFTAPIINSVEGCIRFNTPSLYQGKLFSAITLEFKKGRVIEARAEQGEDSLKAVLDTDRGARYIGEFSFGLNKKIHRPVLSTLFDEKIHGSIHLALGAAYLQCDNGNRSAIHWDLVRLMKDGEIHLDGIPVQKKGRFTVAELKPLN